MGSRARRERQFKDTLADLYEAGKVEIFYTGSMPAWVGTESYWRGHGFKVPAKEQAVGIHAIYSLLLLTPAYALRDVAEITGKKAAERREQFFTFHQKNDGQKHDWFWETYCAPQFDMGEWGYHAKFAAAFNLEPQNVTENRYAIGEEVWRTYTQSQRGKWFAYWRLPRYISEQIDGEFAVEVSEMFGYVPDIMKPKPETPDHDPNDPNWIPF